MKRAYAVTVLSIFALLGAMVGATPAAAQDTGLGGSFITPFPQNDTYQVEVIGDWLAEGLLGGLVEASATSPAGAQFARKRYNLSGLRRSRDIAELEQAMANDPNHIAIVMLGVEDRYSLGSRRKPKADEEWRAEYGARVDQAMKILKKGGRAVYWVGLPNMRRWQDNERAQIMNDVYRERAYLNGVRYIDAFASFIDEGGGYSDYGPDVTGKTRRLRYSDGIHFTDAGYRKLAHFVERELKRDLAQARRERAVPLAGRCRRAGAGQSRPGAAQSGELAPGPEEQDGQVRRGRPRRGGRRRARAEGRGGQGRHQGSGSGWHRASADGGHRAPRHPGIGGGANDAPIERRSCRADGRYPGRPDPRRPHRDELDRAAAWQ